MKTTKAGAAKSKVAQPTKFRKTALVDLPPTAAAVTKPVATRPEGPIRILVASHAHPRLSKGGAEISAYQLYSGMAAQSGYETWFLGCQQATVSERAGAAITQPFSDREFIYSVGNFDWFKFANRDPKFPKGFVELLHELKPDIVHFHHFINFGVEAFQLVRRTLPNAKIILTVHEYLLMCHNYGQMVTKNREHLCYEAAVDKCNKCFPEISPSDFFLRNRYIRNFVDIVDLFIAPSHFLAGRLAQWGLPASKIAMLENVIPHPPVLPEAKQPEEGGPLRIGFFGQISRLKGIGVLFETAKILETEGYTKVVFDIHGDYRGQPPEFQKEFLDQLAEAGSNIRFMGPYEPGRVDLLMQQVDVTIVPSIWWENSPVVVQEAFRNRRPVICSNIGGTAEKVRDGVDGWHFNVGSSLALGALLKRISENRELVFDISRSMQYPAAPQAVVDAHGRLYDDLLPPDVRMAALGAVDIVESPL